MTDGKWFHRNRKSLRMGILLQTAVCSTVFRFTKNVPERINGFSDMFI